MARRWNRGAAARAPLTIALGVLVLGCTDDQATDRTALDDSTLVAVCLTDPPGPEASLITDLCRVDPDGSRHAIREGIDSGTAPALSPDRTEVAFISEGELAVIDVDGSNERLLGVDGMAPEWMPDGRIALVTDGGAGISATDPTQSEAIEVLVDAGDRPLELEGTVIEQFAVSPTDAGLLVALADVGDEAALDDDVFALGLVDADADRMVVVLGPSNRPFSAPDFDPTGESAAVAIDYDIYRVDVASGGTQLVSPRAWMGTSPSWSTDGKRLVWLADRVGPPEGPAALVTVVIDDATGEPTVILGSRNVPFDRLPAMPDW